MSPSAFKRMRKRALLPVAVSLAALAQGCVQEGRSTALDPAPDPEATGVPRAEAPYAVTSPAAPAPAPPTPSAPAAQAASAAPRAPAAQTTSVTASAEPSAAAFAAERQVVAIDNFSFNPPTLTIPAGSAVTWVNRDDVPHTVTANDRSYDSRGMDTGDRYSRTYTAPGTYPYFCAVHPHMTGQIVVK